MIVSSRSRSSLINTFLVIELIFADRSCRVVYDKKYVCSFETWDWRFESHSSNFCNISVFVLSCSSGGLANNSVTFHSLQINSDQRTDMRMEGEQEELLYNHGEMSWMGAVKTRLHGLQRNWICGRKRRWMCVKDRNSVPEQDDSSSEAQIYIYRDMIK
jgi:hypothetical protein